MVQRIPDAGFTLSTPSLFSFSTPIEIQIQEYDLSKLAIIAPKAVEKLKQIPGLHDIGSSIRRGQPEVLIHFKRDKLAFYNLNVQEVADRLKKMVQGDIPTKFSRGDRRVDIRVRLAEDERQHIEDLSNLIINPGADAPLPLGSVASFTLVEGPSEIRRVDQKRAALIHAGLSDVGLSKIEPKIDGVLQELGLTYILGGQSKEFNDSKNSLLLAIALSIFLVYVVMASQFESIIHPMVIIFSIPLAFFGVVMVLQMLNIKLSVLVFLGMILLAGIVVNNAIVLVDYINLLRQRGIELNEAIIKAGSIRLRPILMTTATTALGLLPMALGVSEGSELRQPMAITVIAGLVFSTVLTLVIIPVVYATGEYLKGLFKRT